MIIKYCTQCSEYKNELEFYKNKSSSDGLQAYCKPCWKKAKWSSRNKKQQKEYKDKWRIRNRDRELKKTKEWAMKNAQKRQAHNKVNNSIRDGKIQRLPCEVCGDIKSQAHHEDYSKPLDIIWLCASHHNQLHSSYNDLGINP